MSYQSELQAKLDAVRVLDIEHGKKVGTNELEEKLIIDLQSEFKFSQYDLDESDLIRSIKILDILQSYQEVFSLTNSLRVFYALSKIDVIHAANLFRVSDLNKDDFKHLINTMAKYKLVCINDDRELELTMQGQSLSERIGVDVFI